MSLGRRYVSLVTTHPRAVILALLLLTLVVGGGVVFLDGEIEMVTFSVDSEERDAMQFADEHFASTDHRVTLVVVRDGDVLAPDSIHETMRLQEAIRANETVADTLADERSTVGVGNAIAFVSNPDLTEVGYTIDDELAEIDGHSREEIVEDFAEAIEIDDLVPGDRPSVATLMPAAYQPGDAEAEARLVLVVHDENVADDDLLTAQRAIADHVDSEVVTTDAYTFGEELTFDRGADATAASFVFVGPLALLLIVGVMLLVYREPIDVILGVGGVGLVLLWMAGFLGWTGIGMNQLLVAVPCLLVGLSIDHGFHVVMRYRESLGFDVPPPEAMGTALAGVGVAIGATTLTTMIGFLSGLISPIAVLREFALVSAFGILAAFLIFGVLVPAVKIEIETHRPRNRHAIGQIAVVAKPFRRVVRGANARPVIVVSVAILLALGGVYGFETIDTSTERTDFLPDDQSAALSALPMNFQSGDSSLREEAIYLDDTFDRQETESITILIRGDPKDPATLDAVESAERAAIEATTLAERTDGRPVIHSPLSVLESMARHDEDVAAAFDAADSTGDGVPDREIESLYQAASGSDPVSLSEVVHLGDEEAVRVVVTVDGEADDASIRAEMHTVAEAAGEDAIATGEPIMAPFEDRAVVLTAVGTFLLALVVITLALMAAFRYRHGSWTLGAITTLPVVLALAWVVGLMSALDLPYNAETAIITGIAIGIGVDYTIHVTERFQAERAQRSTEAALEVAVVETGGTLLASAVTTALGFAVLALTFVPSLQRFGLITALFVVAAFVASVVLLPVLLATWADRTESLSRLEARP